MSEQANYFKIGLFVIAALAVLIIVLFLLGTAEMFVEPILVETYIDGSVQGIEVGTPVKQRGVPVGSVDRIDFIQNVYEQQLSFEQSFTVGRYVYILVALDPKKFPGIDETQVRYLIEKNVENGLRFRMMPQGITGVYYLEADYFDPERRPDIKITWEPKHIYVPSLPSFIAQITTSAEEVFARLKKLDIEGVFNKTSVFLETATQAVRDASVSDISVEAEALLSEVRLTNDRIRELLSDSALDTIPGDVSATVASARRIAEDSEQKVGTILERIERASAHAEKVSQSLSRFVESQEGEKPPLQALGETLRQISEAAEGLPETSQQVDLLIRRMNRLLTGQQGNIEDLMENLRALTEDLRQLTEDAKRYPSQLILGEPPPRYE